MFGYVTINRPELKVKDLETYQGYYCGLCHQIRDHQGLSGAFTLNYDMTFLGILLSALYENEKQIRQNHCIFHPVERRNMILTEAGAYAADMNFMMAYHNLMDDWKDEKKITARVLADIYHKKYRLAAEKYPRQHRAMVRYVKKLHACEAERSSVFETAATLTGEMMAEIYVWKEDVWAENLRSMGFYMGKFIYLMDAYDDMEKDKEAGNYNPFLALDTDHPEKKAEEYLKLLMGGCCRAFEMLPILEHEDLLRNILYSGVWMKFAEITKHRCKCEEGKKEHGSI